MANSKYEVLEMRVVIKPAFTELYVLCGPPSDGMLGVQGWHKKVIEPNRPALAVLEDEVFNGTYLTEWDTGAPSPK